MPISKPRFADLDVQSLQRKMDELSSLVQANTGADGTVDVAKLEETVDAAADPLLTSAFERVKHDYRRQVGERLSSGSSPVRVPVMAEPTKLDAGEVQSVMGALLSAKSRLASLDQDGDGKLARAEVEQAPRDRALAGKLARATVIESASEFYDELDTWLHATLSDHEEARTRTYLHDRVARTVEKRVKTPEAQEAARLHFAALLVAGKQRDVVDVKDVLKDAETSFFTRLTGSLGKHLDDDEVRALVGCDDLVGFAADTLAAIQQDLGISLADWLAGDDLTHLDGADDPEFKDYADSVAGPS